MFASGRRLHVKSMHLGVVVEGSLFLLSKLFCPQVFFYCLILRFDIILGLWCEFLDHMGIVLWGQRRREDKLYSFESHPYGMESLSHPTDQTHKLLLQGYENYQDKTQRLCQKEASFIQHNNYSSRLKFRCIYLENMWVIFQHVLGSTTLARFIGNKVICP